MAAYDCSLVFLVASAAKLVALPWRRRPFLGEGILWELISVELNCLPMQPLSLTPQPPILYSLPSQHSSRGTSTKVGGSPPRHMGPPRLAPGPSISQCALAYPPAGGSLRPFANLETTKNLPTCIFEKPIYDNGNIFKIVRGRCPKYRPTHLTAPAL